MNKLNDVFSWQRFLRVFVNDLLLLQARRIAFTSLGLIGAGLIIYATNVNPDPLAEEPRLALACFLFLLIGGGYVFTSMIFNDMHHPLERYHYLMLPCSNLERFASRYLITAPLFVIYAIVLFKVFEVIANAVCAQLWDGATVTPLNFGAVDGVHTTRNAIAGYLYSHVFVFMGAIWFRSYALIKTAVANLAFWSVFGAVSFLALRIFYWDHFISFLEMDPERPVTIRLGFDSDGSLALWQKTVFGAFLLWMLFLAYLGLREHEVQDGL